MIFQLAFQVFRDKLQQIPLLQESGNRELEIIFSNIMEIYDFSVNLLGSLEDTMEVTEENEAPDIGICFEELAEVSIVCVFTCQLYWKPCFRTHLKDKFCLAII